MDYKPSLDLILHYLVWFFDAICIIIILLDIKSFKNNIQKILPYIALCFFFLALLELNYLGCGIPINEVGRILYLNTIRIIQDALFASTGLIIFQKKYLSVIDNNWKESLFIRKIPYSVCIVIIIANITYSFILLKSFNATFFDRGYWNEMMLSSLGAVYEELMVRLFILGGFIFILWRIKCRWELAIVLSTVYWIILHFNGTSQDFVKALQLFPLGLSLGYMLKRYGFESCVFIHLSYNLLGATFFRL
jgi:hypothetical protein